MNSSTSHIENEAAFTEVGAAETLETGVWYVGFPAESAFEKLVSEYTSQAAEAPSIPNDLIKETLAAFMENALNHYFVTPLDTLEATQTQRKIVMVGVNTIRKAVGAVLSKVVAKMAHADRVKLAQYMDVMVTPLGSDEEKTMVIYPIEDAMAEQARQITERARSGEPLAVKSDLQALLISVNEQAMEAYFHIPFKMMSFGPIMSKVVKMTADATRTATQVVINKVISGLSAEEVLRILDYVDALFVKGPAHSGPLER